jgi:16S rRNA (cytidine1402-2'-O)-methyltransferase
MAEAFGAARAAAICRELTKTYEEVRRGGVAELAAWASEGVRGEVTIVVEGAAPAAPLDLDDDALDQLVQEAVATGLSRKDAVSDVAARTGVPRKQVYAAAHR